MRPSETSTAQGPAVLATAGGAAPRAEATAGRVKAVALVAHDLCKPDLVEWVQWNYTSLVDKRLVCTGTTGRLVDSTLRAKLAEDGRPGFPLELRLLKSGPLGGDQQLGALIAEEQIDLVIFFWDPLRSQPHDVDVKALLRIAVVYNVPMACNRASADFLISSPLLGQDYRPRAPRFEEYLQRVLPSVPTTR
jgi:methylglyoxal synthase